MMPGFEPTPPSSNFALQPRYLEFFAGGGMVRAGFGTGWQCAFANDFDFKKAATYQRNWGDTGELVVGDIRNIRARDLPDAELAWASFPCQDLSLAGGGAGLKGERSGTFYPFWGLMKSLLVKQRAPQVIVLENVTGTLTSHQGKDFTAICRAFTSAGYRYGVLLVDAALFVPQSRPRFFVVAVRGDIQIGSHLFASEPLDPFHTRGVRSAYKRLPPSLKKPWVWWNLPVPPPRSKVFADLIEDAPTDVRWHTIEETRRLVSMMSEVNLAKLAAAKRLKRRVVGGLYKRTRKEGDVKVQRAEVRFDDVAGCLRTPSGGSSRQLVIVVEGRRVRSRLISARETARLMGLPESYQLPEKYNEAYHLTGDGVAVPVVQHLAKFLIEPLVHGSMPIFETAA